MAVKLATALAVAVVALAAASVPGSPAEASLYKETFPFSGNDEALALRNPPVNWCGGNAGDPFCNNAPGGPGDNDGGEGAVSSSLNGPDGNVGFAYWSQKGTNAPGYLYTDDFSFNTDTGSQISWFQRDSGLDPVRLALFIGNEWYISEQTFQHQGTSNTDWKQQTATLTGLDYYTKTPTGNLLPGGGLVSALSSLPGNATVDAFGFYLDGGRSANSRFDDVEVVPLPGAIWMMLSAMGLFGGLAMRRRAAA